MADKDNLYERLMDDRRELGGGMEESANPLLRRQELYEMLCHESAFQTVYRWLIEMDLFSPIICAEKQAPLKNKAQYIMDEIADAHPGAYLRICAKAQGITSMEVNTNA